MLRFRHKRYELASRRKRQSRYTRKFASKHRIIMSRVLDFAPDVYAPPTKLPERFPRCTFESRNFQGTFRHVYEYIACLGHCKQWLSDHLVLLGFSGNAFERAFDPVSSSHSIFELLENHTFCLRAHEKLARLLSNKYVSV